MLRRLTISLAVASAFLFATPDLSSQDKTSSEAQDQTENDLEHFYENPYEDVEKPRRQADYRRYYNENIAGDPTAPKIIQEILAPRVYDEQFDTDLPGRQPKGQWSLRLNPKFSDFLDDDYVRFPVGVRYNFSKWFEAFSEIGSYFPNPFGDGDRSGFYNWRVGGKYSWVGISGTDYNVAAGLRADMPFSNPPYEIADGFARYEPYISVSRQIPNHPHWLGYLSMTYQLVEDSPFTTEPIQPQPRDRIFLKPGIIYYPRGHLRYSFELEYRTNILNSGNHNGDSLPPGLADHPGFRRENWILATEDVHEVIAYPAITWFPTRKTRQGFIIPGNWDIGFQLKLPLIEETGQDIGLSVRFRWYYEYRKFIAQGLPGLLNGNGNGH